MNTENKEDTCTRCGGLHLNGQCPVRKQLSKSQLKRLAVQEASHLSGIPLDHEPEKPTS